MNTDNTDAARAWLLARRHKMDSEIAALTGRRTEIDYLLSELETPMVTNGHATPERDLTNPFAPREPLPHPPKPTSISPRQKGVIAAAILDILKLRGVNGITPSEGRRELRARGIRVADSTISARLSGLYAAGKITRVPAGHGYRSFLRPDLP